MALTLLSPTTLSMSSMWRVTLVSSECLFMLMLLLGVDLLLYRLFGHLYMLIVLFISVYKLCMKKTGVCNGLKVSK